MAIPKTMKAAVVESFGDPLAVREVPVPTPGPGQALVEIVASGVCHTDLHAAEGDWPVKPTVPFIPGHEGAGIVAALGPGVTHLQEGDRVGIAWLHSGLWSLRVLFVGLGNALSRAKELRLFRGRQLRPVRGSAGGLPGTDSHPTFFCGCGANSLRRRHHL